MRGRATGRSGADTVAWYSPGLDLSSAEIALIELATRTIDGTSDATTGEEGIHTMGAAVRTADGRVFVGANLFHFTGGPCAELVALSATRTTDAHQVTDIVAVGNQGRGVCAPCGRCRQIFVDYHPDLRVIVPSEGGPRSVLASELLPGAYKVDHL